MNNQTVPFEQLPDEALLRWRDICEYGVAPFCRSEAHARAQRGEFPAFRKIGKRASAIRVGDLRAWLSRPLEWRAPVAGDQTR
jgi:hypothetical protein